MAGIKGRSGGRRKDAGRPPKNISIGRDFKFTDGDSVSVSYIEKDGNTQELSATLHLNRANSGYCLVLESEMGWRATIKKSEQDELT